MQVGLTGDEQRMSVFFAAWWLLAHATIVLGLVASLWTVTRGPEVDANIGAGFIGMLLGIFGAPWSLFAIVPTSWQQGTLVVASALTNLSIHGVLLWRARTRPPGTSGYITLLGNTLSLRLRRHRGIARRTAMGVLIVSLIWFAWMFAAQRVESLSSIGIPLIGVLLSTAWLIAPPGGRLQS